MSFDADVVKDGVGRAIRVDISTDNFSTIAYRYSDKPGYLDGTNEYEGRILSRDSIRRALGQNRIAASSQTSLELDNVDGALDWLCTRSGIAAASQARFRIYVVLYDPAASPLVFTSKLLGEFVLSGWPELSRSTVRLDLADDFMGNLGTGVLLPTLLDWQAVGDASTNPIFNGLGYPSSINPATPVQLAFGEDWLLALPHLIPWQNNGAGDYYEDMIIVPLYATTDLSAVSQELVTQVAVDVLEFPTINSVDFLQNPVVVNKIINQSYFDQATQTDIDVWTVEKSPTISKGGLDFQIVYLVVRTDLGARIKTTAYFSLISNLRYEGDYQPQAAVDSAGDDYTYAACVKSWYVRGAPLSQITNPPNQYERAHAVDVVTDLVSEYSGATVDATSAARVKTALANAACFGVVQPWTEAANNIDAGKLPLSLRQVLSELAQSSDLDVFVNWDGEVAFTADIYDFLTASQGDGLIEIDETEISDLRTRVPSDGERHAPFNRVSFEGGRPSPVNGLGVPFQGPFDISDADIPITSRVVEVVIHQGWNTFRQQRELDPRSWRPIDSSARDMITFRIGIQGLRLDLGDYFKITWTRTEEIGGPYESTVFQCEGITYSPGDDVVEIAAIWRDDTVSERQYLLDDETLLTRTIASATTAAPDGSNAVDIGGVSDMTGEVDPGDLLVLRDTTQAADVFTRNGAWRIITVGDVYFLIEQNGEGNYPAAGSVAAGQWSVVRGATTSPTAVSDPTNYPSGSDMYGKAVNVDDDYSDAQTGNRLINN